jgi:2-keto-3-deoxy-L-rhamnonate aldolase RhmA
MQSKRTNRFKESLAAGRRLMGCWSSLASPTIAEILAGADLDWVVLDMEHGHGDLSDILAQLQAMNGGKAHPIVRVPTNDRFTIRRLVDMGVDTVLVPMVGSAAEARHAVESGLYPPAGARGMAGSLRAGQYGRWPNYLVEANAGICVLVQIESQAGLDHLDEILAVEGLGGIVLGPADLSASMGFVGQPYHPKVLEALRHVIGKTHAAKLPIGSIATDSKTIETFLEMGMNFLAVASDTSTFVRALDDTLDKWRPRFG